MTSESRSENASALYQEALATFARVLQEARDAGDLEPTAMTVATRDGEGIDARVVLLKGVDEHGFQFHSNYESAKGVQLAAHPQAALCFHWKTLRHGVQVRVQGRVERLPADLSDAYFASRPRGSQIGAWASRQSRPLRDRTEFETRISEMDERYDGSPVPRPPHWGGYRVVPDRIEFWYGAKFRLHERVVYAIVDGAWTSGFLYP